MGLEQKDRIGKKTMEQSGGHLAGRVFLKVIMQSFQER